MTEGQREQIFVNNEFGTVTDKRVVYFRQKDCFNEGTREDVLLQHVTSVRFEKARSIKWGVILVFVGLVTFPIAVGVVPLTIGILLLWGFPTVFVNVVYESKPVLTAVGGDSNAAKGWPWQGSAAKEFVKALHSQHLSASRTRQAGD